jgi:hypothetical protein
MRTSASSDPSNDKTAQSGSDRSATIPKSASRVLRRWLLGPAWALLGSVILGAGAAAIGNTIDSRLTSNLTDTDATVVWIHRNLFGWKTVRVSYPSTSDQTIVATLHTGAPDANHWARGDQIPVSYNSKHPSAVGYYDSEGYIDDTRENITEWVSFFAVLTGTVALIVLLVQFRRRSRYKQCFAGRNDAIPATILAAIPDRFGASHVDLEIPSDFGPWPLAVRLLGGQDAKTFAPGQSLGVRLGAEGRGPVVLSSGGGERVLLGRALGPVRNLCQCRCREMALMP